MSIKIDNSAKVNNQRSMDYLFKEVAEEIAVRIIDRHEDSFDTDVAEAIERIGNEKD